MLSLSPAMMITPQYMTTHQFMVSLSTVAVKGKKAKTKTGSRKANAPILTAMPNRPRVQR